MNKYIESPLNYTGSKYDVLEQLLSYFPMGINTFIDLFSGGGNVGINVNANKVICNDILNEVIEFCIESKNKDVNTLLTEIDAYINKYQLSKTNKEGYLQLRNDYNKEIRTAMKFYTLVTHSFNNDIRFNSKKEFNLPFGERYFNPILRNKFIMFVEHLKTKDVSFTNFDYKDVKLLELKENDFVYADPPYLITCASYNERGGWTEKHEHELIYTLDYLNVHNVKFALSNALIHKGRRNEKLIEWSKKYNVKSIDKNYANSSYNTKNRDKNSTQEVLITNF